MKDDKEARLDKGSRQKSEEHKHTQLKIKEGFRLALESRLRAEEYERLED